MNGQIPAGPRGRAWPFADLWRTSSHGPWAMVCILLLAYALRLTGLTSESLWIDEGYSLALAGYGPKDIVRGAIADQHPPFYYLLLHGWLFAGRSVFQLRYLSALLGTLGVAAGAWVSREWMGERVGLATALFLACSPLHIWYSQEARMYVLLALLTTLSTGLMWRLVEGRRGWLLYACCTIVALYTHLFAGLVVLFQNVVALLYLARGAMWQPSSFSERARGFGVRWLGVQAVLWAAFAPWMPVVIYQMRSHRMDWVAPTTLSKVGGGLLLLLLGEAGARPLGVLAWIGLLAPVGLTVRAIWKRRAWTELERYGFALLWFVVPFGLTVALSLVRPVFQSKQMLMLLTPLVLMVVVGLVRLPRLARGMLFCLWAVFVVCSLGAIYRVETKDDWRGAAAYVQGRYQAGDVLYLNPAAGMLTLETYLSRSLPYEGYPPEYDVRRGGWEGEPVTPAIAAQEMEALAASYQRVWLIEFTPEFWDPEGLLLDWLVERGTQSVEEDFGRIRVRLYDLAREPGGW